MLSDAVVILIAAGIAIFLRAVLLYRFQGSAATSEIPVSPLGAAYLIWFVLSYVLVSRRYGLYAPVPLRNGAHETRLVTQAALNSGLLLCGAMYMTHAFGASRLLVLIFVLTACVALGIRRTVWRISRYHDYERGIELRNLVILGTNRLSAAMGHEIAGHYRMGYNLRGYISLPGSREEVAVNPDKILGGIESLRALVRAHFVDELVIAQPCPTETAIRLVEEARDIDVDIRSIAGFYPDLAENAPREQLGGFPVVLLHRRERRVFALILKRVADIVLSLIALIILFPIMAAIGLAIAIEGKGAILYVSQRVGKRGRIFPCFKFRTMVANAEARRQEVAALNERDGILFKATNDPRITPVGRVLRKYSLDELPQFFNVLRGEMSIVGPRPPIASEVERYELEHLRRLEVLPGLTGLWQVQARQDSSFARYIALDTAYVENWSFWLDLTILLRTASVVFRGTGS